MKPQGFEKLLAGYIDERRRRPFAWGTNDCVTFTADWLQRLTGTDPLGDLRGTWDDAASAARALASVGGLLAAMDARYERIPWAFAQRGDVVAVDVGGHLGLYVCVGRYAAGPGELEMLLNPMHEAVAAWRI